MSYGLTANDWMDPPVDSAGPAVGAHITEGGLIVLPADAPPQVYRSAMIPVAFGLAVAISGLGYIVGGVQVFSDLAFLVVSVTCIYLVAVELVAFGQRLGIGAILIYGGILIWFCHDYASNWFNHDYTRFNKWYPGLDATIGPEVVGRAMFYHCLFIEMMVIAFRFPVLRSLERVVTGVPEPANDGFYFGLVVGLLVLGSSSFIFTKEFPLISMARAGLWFLPGIGPVQWTVGRTNLATSWGAYVAQLIQVGQVGGIMAAVYALLVARSTMAKAFGWFVWAYWLSFSMAGERRGEIAFMALPVAGIVFLKFQSLRDPSQRLRNMKWMVATALVTAGAWVAVEYQSADRSISGQFHLFQAAGNTMFSEGLNTWQIIPSRHGFAYDSVVGEAIVRPVPDTVWLLVTGPIPRMIWPGKPVEQFALWYSAYISHDNRGVTSGGLEGTTISSGAVGYWYFRYGPPGVIEGGLIYGFMMGLAERSLRRAQGRPMKVMFALAFAAFLFRCYRDLWWHNLYPMLIGGVVLYAMIKFVFGARPDGDDAPVPNGPIQPA
jgi:hypothetical protein